MAYFVMGLFTLVKLAEFLCLTASYSYAQPGFFFKKSVFEAGFCQYYNKLCLHKSRRLFNFRDV